MEKFPRNNLSSFTTLLSALMTLTGDWQVALLEFFWLATVRNNIEGKITVSKSVVGPQLALRAMSHIIPSRRPRTVSMRVPQHFRKEPALEVSKSEACFMKSSCYSFFDDILESAKKNDKGNNLPPRTRKIHIQPSHQYTNRGKVIRRRNSFTQSFVVMWNITVW